MNNKRTFSCWFSSRILISYPLIQSMWLYIKLFSKALMDNKEILFSFICKYCGGNVPQMSISTIVEIKYVSLNKSV